MRESKTEADRKQVTAAISKKALIPLYLAIPAFYFLPVGIPTIIANVKYRIKKAAKDALTNSMGLPSADSVTGQIVGDVTNAADEATGGCLSSLGNFFRSLMIVLTILMAVIWVIWCIVMTFRHFDNKLTVVNGDVYCSSRGQHLSTTLTEIDNVFIEQSIWGKLFDYGNITVAAKNGSLTVRNIANPNDIANILKSSLQTA